jgi:parallel beta helix pectate lyase-like protein
LARRRIVLAFTALVAALSVAQTANASRPPAYRLSCGDTVTTDTVLRADIVGCAGTALVIGADGVRLDLGGHAVDGAILATGHADLSLLNGAVYGDVRFEDVRRASVRRLQVRRGSIACLNSAGCAIVKNLVTAGGIAICQSESGVPNRVRGNVVRGAPGAGIAASRTDTTSIAENVVRDSGIGIETSHAADLRIERNLIVDNAGDGLSGSFGSAADIVRNVIARNGGDGISLRTWGGLTLIARNLVYRNGGSGIFGAAVAHWAVVRNLASGNGAAGIAITGAVDDATLARNRARRNRGLGIDAAPGVTDGGGNRAGTNGAAAQCAGIACK